MVSRGMRRVQYYATALQQNPLNKRQRQNNVGILRLKNEMQKKC